MSLSVLTRSRYAYFRSNRISAKKLPLETSFKCWQKTKVIVANWQLVMAGFPAHTRRLAGAPARACRGLLVGVSYLGQQLKAGCFWRRCPWHRRRGGLPRPSRWQRRVGPARPRGRHGVWKQEKQILTHSLLLLLVLGLTHLKRSFYVFLVMVYYWNFAN